MGTSELKGIYIDTHNSRPFSSGNSNHDDKLSSSGVSSSGESIRSNNNYTSELPRKRNLPPDAGEYGSQLDDYEMDKIRCLMAHVDGRGSGSSIPSSHRGSIEPSLMSTVFAVVLVIIISISVYAFASLFRAVFKRMNP